MSEHATAAQPVLASSDHRMICQHPVGAPLALVNDISWTIYSHPFCQRYAVFAVLAVIVVALTGGGIACKADAASRSY